MMLPRDHGWASGSFRGPLGVEALERGVEAWEVDWVKEGLPIGAVMEREGGAAEKGRGGRAEESSEPVDMSSGGK